MQAKLRNELTRNKGGNKKNLSFAGANSTMENIGDIEQMSTKAAEELELKIRQIENLKLENEQLKKSKQFLKSKVEELESKENDLIEQIKKYVDLVKHLEMERNQAVAEREQFYTDKLNTDKKLETILSEFNEKMLKEKELILNNVESQVKQLTEQVILDFLFRYYFCCCCFFKYMQFDCIFFFSF